MKTLSAVDDMEVDELDVTVLSDLKKQLNRPFDGGFSCKELRASFGSH